MTMAAHAVLQYRVRYHLFFACPPHSPQIAESNPFFSDRQSYFLLSRLFSLGDEAKVVSDDEGHHAKQTVSTTKH